MNVCVCGFLGAGGGGLRPSRKEEYGGLGMHEMGGQLNGVSLKTHSSVRWHPAMHVMQVWF